MQTEYIGNGSFNKIQGVLNKLKGKKVLLVTGKKSFDLSNAKICLEKMLNNRIIHVFSNFETNPKVEDVVNGILLFKQYNPDLIIAIGGGSVLDMAKLINILSAQKDNDVIDIIKNPELIKNKGVPLVAIPTTSGPGSQATHFAVVYINKRKYSLAHNYMLPNYSIIDSNLSDSVPKHVAIAGVMDALSQAVESFWSLNATHESKEYASSAIKLLLGSADFAINERHQESMQNISLASHLSGKAINITKTTAPHAISYTLTSHFNIAHGHAVALLVAPAAYISYTKNNQDFNNSLEKIFKLFSCRTIDDFYRKWLEFMIKFGLKTKLKDLNVSLEDLDLIVKNVNLERLKGHPVNLTKVDLDRIVEMAITD